jgi:hypothetical protein
MMGTKRSVVTVNVVHLTKVVLIQSKTILRNDFKDNYVQSLD